MALNRFFANERTDLHWVRQLISLLIRSWIVDGAGQSNHQGISENLA